VNDAPENPLPYDLHTNRELEFMLERGKPLAHFYDVHPSEPDEVVIPEIAFAPYVEEGRFVERELIEPPNVPPPKDHPHLTGTRHVFYAHRTEAWRIDAYITMQQVAAKAGRSEGFERLQDSLLGYEDWQTDIHLERLRVSPHAKRFYWLRKP
jgi:hypothetical protein